MIVARFNEQPMENILYRLSWHPALLVTLLCVSFIICPVYGQVPDDPTEQVPTPPIDSPKTDANPNTAGSYTKKFLKDTWLDQKAIWSAPFRMNRGQFFKIALPLAAGSAALFATDADAMTVLPNTPDQVRWSKQVSRIGAVYTLGGVVSGTMVVGSVKHKPQVFEIGHLATHALVDSIIVSYALKYATARERPYVNDGQGRFWKGGDSFPSGHAMHTWATAMVVAHSPGAPKWFKIATYGIATAVSLSRWSSQKHFPSDILVGGVFGGLIGEYVSHRGR